MRIIPTYLHGILDYLIGIFLLAAPNLFGFTEMGGAAVFIPRLVGALLLAQNLLTRHELGLIKVIPVEIHLALDRMLAVLLLLSPWLFGFARAGNHVWLPHIIAAGVIFVLSFLTHVVPRVRTMMPRPAH